MMVHLSSCGNPDHNQYAPISEPVDISVTSLKEAVEECERYINENNLGGGNWDGGQVSDNGRIFAYISYNGRIWDRKYWESDAKEILIQP